MTRLSIISIAVLATATFAAGAQAQTFGDACSAREAALGPHMCSMMFVPNSEHLIFVAPSMRRAKS